jgi:hypothetical protein
MYTRNTAINLDKFCTNLHVENEKNYLLPP